MINDVDEKNILTKIDELSDGLNKISERQNSQYTDIIMQLNELKDEIHNEHSDPEDTRSDDELYVEAHKAVIKGDKASTSYLQRKLGIGYSRAAQLMDTLETKGIIGPGKEISFRDENGNFPRESKGSKSVHSRITV